MRGSVWLSDEHLAPRIQPHCQSMFAVRAGGLTIAGVISGIVHVPRQRLPLVRLPAGDGPRSGPVCALGANAASGRNCFDKFGGNGRSAGTQMIDFMYVKAAPLGGGRKRGRKSRPRPARAGGRKHEEQTTRRCDRGTPFLISFMEAKLDDRPVAERLICRVKSRERLLGDKAYESAESREELNERGTKWSFRATAATESNASAPASASATCVGISRVRSTG